MAFHAINDNQANQAILVIQLGIANATGSGAGAAVTVPVTITLPSGMPPTAAYFVDVSTSQPCFVSVTNKSTSASAGLASTLTFTVTLTPAATTTLAAGTFDIAVLG